MVCYRTNLSFLFKTIFGKKLGFPYPTEKTVSIGETFSPANEFKSAKKKDNLLSTGENCSGISLFFSALSNEHLVRDKNPGKHFSYPFESVIKEYIPSLQISSNNRLT